MHNNVITWTLYGVGVSILTLAPFATNPALQQSAIVAAFFCIATTIVLIIARA